MVLLALLLLPVAYQLVGAATYKDALYNNPEYTEYDPKVSLLIEAAIEQYHQKTCIVWKQVFPAYRGHKVRFYQGNGCWSFIGKNVFFFPAQNISIGPGCEYFHTVVQEMGHATGMFHTQQGMDRDNYVVIDMDNVEPGKESNFEKAFGAKNWDIPYNYYSVMHYAYWAFSKTGTPTIISKEIDAQYLMGADEEGLVFTDAKAINTAYKCIDDWQSDCPTQECYNGGYVGRKCVCVCPPNTDGEHCEHLTGREYPLNPDCGVNVTYPTIIASPDLYGLGHNRDCSWYIQPPKGMLPKVIISYSSMFGDCWRNILTVRDHDLYLGTSYCHSYELPEGKTFTGTKQGLVLHFVSRYDPATVSYKGFSADISFFPDPDVD